MSQWAERLRIEGPWSSTGEGEGAGAPREGGRAGGQAPAGGVLLSHLASHKSADS